MGYSPWGLKESDTTKQLNHNILIMLLGVYLLYLFGRNTTISWHVTIHLFPIPHSGSY